MIVQEISKEKTGVFLCREDVRVRSADDTNSLHALYEWGATVTLVTQLQRSGWRGRNRWRQPWQG
jgi:hypothetical protein